MKRQGQMENWKMWSFFARGAIAAARGGLSKGLRGAIAQGHHKIGGTTLADCKNYILVAYIIFLKGTYICDPVILIHLP